jgi:heavy metal translocating P-type ATPase
VDRLARVFVPVVMTVALVTAAGWWLAGVGAAHAVLRGVTVLLIACPCALGVATPLALMAAVSAASRRGILVSDTRVLETAARVDTLLIDKTGTLTEGEFRVVDADERYLAAVASLERSSEHPLGRAVVRAAARRGLAVATAEDVVVQKGAGITGCVGGRAMFVGSRRLAGAGVDDALERRAVAHEQQGHTIAFYGFDGRATGLLAFGDRIRPGAAGAIAELVRRGVRPVLVSGDARATTARVAAEAGIEEYHAQASPEDKAALVSRLRGAGHVVAMAGDGINDAPALAAADLGIALSTGTDIAMKAAGIIILSPELRQLVDALDLARRTLTLVRQNLFWAFGYNLIGVGLAVAGLLHPIFAAAAMVLSSVSVILNALRAR